MLILFLFTDLTDQSSFERAKFWVNELKQTEEVWERGGGCGSYCSILFSCRSASCTCVGPRWIW